jgi:hypothetical protein
MDGIRGMSGWRWIFSVGVHFLKRVTILTTAQIEGGVTMALAIISIFTLPSFPEKAKWMKPNQRLYLFQKLEQDHGHHEREKVTMRTLTNVSSDWVFWLQGSVYCFNVGTANATAFFSPTIIAVSLLQPPRDLSLQH